MNSLNIEPVRENERNTNGIFQNKKKYIYNEMDVIRGEKIRVTFLEINYP